jgi:hypothetical protein
VVVGGRVVVVTVVLVVGATVVVVATGFENVVALTTPEYSERAPRRPSVRRR